MYVNRNFYISESAEFHLLFSKHCPQNNLNLGIKTKHAPTGVDATVGLVKGYIIYIRGCVQMPDICIPLRTLNIAEPL